MRDDFLTADWARHHTNVTATIRTFLAALKTSFETLNRHQFEAPWRTDWGVIASRAMPRRPGYR